jgi:pyridinium-3,5-biscarboxylic acid mononucleotide sulfurtransferase
MNDATGRFQIPRVLLPQWQALNLLLARYDCMAIAYSGGVDSTFLAWFATKVSLKNVLPVLMVTPLVGKRECQGARQTARQLELPLQELKVDVLSHDDVAGNSRNRCYACKHAMVSALSDFAKNRGYSLVLDGTNADDLSEYRPGRRAAHELGVLSPLALAGFSKPMIRELSRLVGLPNWNKPSQACLATRVPYGCGLTSDLLEQIDRAEAFLLELGCTQVRVRLHDRIARIELPPEEFPVVIEKARRQRLVEYFNKLGFIQVSLDLAGYRSGSADVDLA